MVADFSKKQKQEVSGNKIALQIASVLFVIIIGILIFSDIRIYQKRKELVSEISNYQQQISELQKSSQELKDNIANSNNPDYIEKIAYEQLGEQKPGEKEVIFVTPPQKAQTAAVSQNSWPSWLNNLWQWIKNKF